MDSGTESEKRVHSQTEAFGRAGSSGTTQLKRAGRRVNGQYGTTTCPVCGITIKLSEAEQHFSVEVNRLHELSSTKDFRRTAATQRSDREHHGNIIKKIRRNRSKRITQRTLPPHKRRKLPGEVVCPICQEQLNHLPEEERLLHADRCLNTQPSSSANGFDDVDIVGGSTSGSELEEYEWAGHTRVRAASVASFVPKNNLNGVEDDVGDLDVDGDERSYGDPQFTEADLISSGSHSSDQKIREVMICTAGANNGSFPDVPSKWDTLDDLTLNGETSKQKKSCELKKSSRESFVVSSLKTRIDELETQLKRKSTRCLVCLEGYTDPLVSVSCWHVYCKDCWLKTLSCKKLCPQCSMITNPADLRKVYL